MICSAVKRQLGFLFAFLLRFILRSFTRAMGCFLTCLRPQDDDGLPTSQLVSDSRGVVTSRNPLSLFLSKAFKIKEDTPRIGRDDLGLGSQRDDKGLKDEATFRKACGSLAGNPAEIRKASEKSTVLPCSKDSESSRFHSWLPNTSLEKPQVEVQPSITATPIKFCEEWGNGKDSLERTPSSSISSAQDTQCDSRCSTDERRTGSLHTVYGTCANEAENNAASASPWPSATDIQRRNKSFRLEYETDLSSCGYKQSPYPTPLKLSDAMQTPGTVYPVTFKDQPNDKPRVMSQILYSINNVGKNVSQCEILEEEYFHPEQDSGELSSSSEQPQNDTPTPKNGLKEISYENESKVEASISSWLKLASVIKERNGRMETAYSQIPHSCKSPADRPIIGMVAAHWNEDENPQIPSPKSWDGNGIPNTTNKYKEDQKVNWHATPFEERLEKALSEKSFISQRNHVCGKPNTFENEDNDTALCQLQSSTHPSM